MMKYEVSESLKSFYTLNGRPVCPLIMAVTGHRDIHPDAKDRIKAQVRETLLRIYKFWQKANRGLRVPLLLLNGMAAGADQLVGEVVLELKNEKGLDCLKLVSVLPMPWEEYQKDFQTSLEVSQTETLREKADAEIVIQQTGENRDEQYASLGKMFAHSAYLMLALWDGKEGKPGGTVDVVRYELQGADPHIQITEYESPIRKSPWETVQPCGGVFQIVTPRVGSSEVNTAGEARICTLQMDGSIASAPAKIGNFLHYPLIKKGLRLLARCNRDMIRGFHGMEEVERSSEKYLLDGFQPSEGGNLASLVDYYKIFDALSLHFQKSFVYLVITYLLVTFLLGATFYLKTYLFLEATWFVTCMQIVHTLCIIALWGLFFWNCKNAQFYERYHGYRAIAEALRVQIFWYMANISDPVMNNYRSHRISEIDWIRMTLFSICLPNSWQSDAPQDHPGYEFLYKRWLSDQCGFFSKKRGIFQKKAKKWNILGTFCAFFAIIWIFSRIFVSKAWLVAHPFTSVIAVVLGVAGPCAACCYLYSRFRCYDSLKARYSKMVPIYCEFEQYVKKQLENVPLNDSQIQDALYSFGICALTENADWYLTKRKLTLPS